jgi:hypothetical protein
MAAVAELVASTKLRQARFVKEQTPGSNSTSYGSSLVTTTVKP